MCTVMARQGIRALEYGEKDGPELGPKLDSPCSGCSAGRGDHLLYIIEKLVDRSDQWVTRQSARSAAHLAIGDKVCDI